MPCCKKTRLLRGGSTLRIIRYVLFKWLCHNHPEKNVIYAIRKNAADYANVANLGKVIEYGSYQHWYFILQPLFVATHLGEYAVLIP